MKKIFIGAAILVGAIVIYSLTGSSEQSPEQYKNQITKDREERDAYMNESSDSPFLASGQKDIHLKYFPIDEKYKISAKIEKVESKQFITLGSSTGEPTKYLKYAYAHFKIDDKAMKLLILKNMDASGTLFTAFADDTSGETTYGAGRYLDLSFKNAKRITIDFNTAYSPYCNYNDSYSCPFPPAENILPVAITAGEKDYKI